MFNQYSLSDETEQRTIEWQKKNDADDEFDGQKAKDVMIFAHDVGVQIYGFDTTHSPYLFISGYIERDIESNFLDWFVGFVNDELDGNPYINKEIRMKYRLI